MEEIFKPYIYCMKKSNYKKRVLNSALFFDLNNKDIYE